MKIGYVEDWTGAATQKVLIVAETTDGRFVCKNYPVEMMRPWDGSKYLAEPLTGIFLRNKNKVKVVEE